ncbi:ectoine/hydroxyectoine ABC transporter permease subunit EhuD [Paenactinomyces guangxiensis]|uniref:Ectoine/hydroxyectoine ABC transporter permease subunit EhuD n=1 Tax=Paenactinomyces guangxiensis TaxID=1490290 RepID=A0A7W1WRB3_9BACL|nr:ectoine/hydroxyectoine ABC transporter permease subunit EhuD [Paenactinomyces guangxiensis]MBA4494649.1 ectoine/hydroxyectoine ABC transporter permease subunit EhuD [Paenactinomyces guangxiensis]MBH8591733.1 ectoine/hydroxyectoine ABC transporter permease subunit EhuD [Paenactinomyces guangxiensis]
MSWSWDFTLKILPQLLDAAKVTISATLVAFVISLAGGLLLTFGRRSKVKLLSMICYWFIEFVRSTPLLVQLFFIFYVAPDIGLKLSPFTAGVLGLGLHYSTYMSEVYRAGIEAVPRGQWEAATALNFSKVQMWKSVILPQAIRPIVPVLGNYGISMFKETPVLSVITVIELLGRAQIIGSTWFRYLEPITLVGVFFFIMSYVSSLLVRRLEMSLKLQQK